MSRFSVSSEISNAIGSTSDMGRTAALRKLVQKLSEPASVPPPSSALCGDVIATLRQRTLARINDTMRASFRNVLIDELNVVIFANEGKRDHVICGLSRMTGLPADKIDRAFCGTSADFLLVLCRTHNFAWSSVKALLALHAMTIDNAGIEEMHEEYHHIPIQAAKRIGRFLHVHLARQA